jgi:putative alpha-1,2-mannosidase
MEEYLQIFIIILLQFLTMISHPANTWHGDTINMNKLLEEGDHAGAVLGFKTKKGEKINVRIASSFISPEQALLNLTRETGTKDFETIKKEGKEAWNKQLGRIDIEGGTADQQRTFYSCLYRMILFPRQFFEINERNEIIHYSPYNGEVLPGYMYTDNGFWDTFRALFPFITLMYPDVDSKDHGGARKCIQREWLAS